MEKLTGTTRMTVGGDPVGVGIPVSVSVDDAPAGMSVILSVGGVGDGILVGISVSVPVGGVPAGILVGV
jgi:hypothetical protein